MSSLGVSRPNRMRSAIPEELLQLPFPSGRWPMKEMRVRRPGFHFCVLPNGSCEVEIDRRRVLIKCPELPFAQVLVSETHVDVSLVYNVYGLPITLAFLDCLVQNRYTPAMETWLTAYLAGSLIVMTGEFENELFLMSESRIISRLVSELYKRETASQSQLIHVAPILAMYGPESGVWASSTATVLMSDGSILLWCGSHETGTQQLVSELENETCRIELLSQDRLKLDGDEIKQLTCSLQRYADYFRVRGWDVTLGMEAVLDDLSERVTELNTLEAAAWLIQLRHDMNELSDLVLRSREELDWVLQMAIELARSLTPWTATTIA